MRKKLLSLAVASLVCGSVAEARFYLGVDVGYSGAMPYGGGEGMYYGDVKTQDLQYMFKTYSASNGSESVKVEPFVGFNASINLGAENFYLDNYLGFRWGASVGYTTLSKTTQFKSQGQYGTETSSIMEEYNFLDLGLSLDVIVNLWSNGSSSVGVFGGVEGEYHYFLSGKYDNYSTKIHQTFKDLHSYGVNGRMGVSTLIASHHRIDLTAKLPVLIAGNNGFYGMASYLAKTSFDIGYKYVF